MTANRNTMVSGNADFRKILPPEGNPQDLLQQIDGAQRALEAQLAALRAADASHTHSEVEANAIARIQRLAALRDQLVGGAKDVTALRADIGAAVAASLAYTSQVTTAVNASQAGTAQAALREASANARQSVSDFTRDFYERRIFDPYLRFASAEDERAYREREAERQREIEKARAERTPEGDLRAVNLSIDQLKDAGTHGADRSPDYERTMTGLKGARTNLAAALTPKAKMADETARTTTVEDAAPPTQTAALSPDLIAKLRGAGVSVPDQKATGHGLNQYAPSNSAGVVRT